METHSRKRVAGLKTNKLMSFPYQESAADNNKDELVLNFTVYHLSYQY